MKRARSARSRKEARTSMLPERSPSIDTGDAPRAVSPLLRRYRAVRARTLALAAPLSAEDCALQSMPDASPVK